ncbi:RnfABCDGE type electron transport complex subunit D [Thiolinea disciformis]|uniref:RnfABCDGE type electron transport complex subunit D n=1 Tax=Thiolinea disciformis TaxID=125614 RepID=UPI000381D2C6|nr:RnfABCDGE type electron transport complex subunit D [Thiolinea disciformis]
MNVPVRLSYFDPRYYQLIVQTSLLSWGWISLEFPFYPTQILAILITTFLVQATFLAFYRLPQQYLSTFNTSLSLILLLYANHWIWLALAAFIAIASKFILRWNERHIFNPSNIGIVIVLLLSDSAWVAVGKWGQGLWLFLLVAGLGLVVILGFQRMASSLVFLATYSTLLLLRALWLGDPWQIPFHQLQNGALLIFTFFMLSDPMTTPKHLAGRCLFGSGVALLAAYLQFAWFIPNAFLYALAFASPFVPLINYYKSGELYHWPIRSSQ